MSSDTTEMSLTAEEMQEKKELLERIERVLYATKDPTVQIFGTGHPPAMTTMLFRVCDNDQTKFEEAIRLVELFITEALSQ